METIKYFDFFSGIGGFRLAAKAASTDNIAFKPVGFSEIDETCVRFYKTAFPSTDKEYYLPDINDANSVGKNGSADFELPDFELLLGGFPCQPFANIGKHGGFNDKRGVLIFKIAELLKYYQPRFFVLENVQKLRNLHRGGPLCEIIKLLEGCNYNVTVWDLCASDYGLPHQRRRLFFCGSLREHFKPIELNLPPKSKLAKAKYPTTWHLAEKNMPKEHIIPAKTRETVLRKNPKWEGDLEINRQIARPLTSTMHKWHRANQDNYFSVDYVSAKKLREYDPNKLDLANTMIRRITPLEGLRLQGFPDKFEKIFQKLDMRFTPIYKMLGNAVPVNLASSVIFHFVNGHYR